MRAFEPDQVAILASKELRDRLRSRWVVAVAAIFTLFALVIAYFGTAQEGAVGFRGMDVTIASLVSLAIYLVPLIALILGYDAIVGERERGSLDLLLSMPITRLELVLGKFLGLSAAMAAATVVGFGLAGLFLSYGIGRAALAQYGFFMLTTVLLGEAFLAIAVLVSVVARTKVAASAIAIVLWFAFVLVYDLVLLGALVATEGRYLGEIFPVLLMLNPADVFRILNVYGMEELRTLYGLATVMPEALASPWLLGAAMLAWIVVPLALAYARLLGGRAAE
jgi:Cu-processing system permease protein